jgi:hypothetical protein
MRYELWGGLVMTAGILAGAGISLRAAEVSDTRESERMSIVVRTYTQPAGGAMFGRRGARPAPFSARRA